MPVDLREQDILDRLYDRLRWPKAYPWGQPSIEVIKEDTRPYQDFFLEDGFIDSDKCIKYYQDGYTLVISNIGWFHKETKEVLSKNWELIAKGTRMTDDFATFLKGIN